MNITICPSCNVTLNSNMKFCTQCGYELAKPFKVYCPKCSSEYDGTVKFCTKDGTATVTEDLLKRTCCKCGKEYTDSFEFCPADGGPILPLYEQNKKSISSPNLTKVKEININKLADYLFIIDKKLKIKDSVPLKLRISAWLLYFIVFLSILSIPSAITSIQRQADYTEIGSSIPIFSLFVSIGVLLFIANKIHHEKKWAKTVFIVLFIIGLISFVTNLFIESYDYRTTTYRLFSNLITIIYIPVFVLLTETKIKQVIKKITF